MRFYYIHLLDLFARILNYGNPLVYHFNLNARLTCGSVAIQPFTLPKVIVVLLHPFEDGRIWFLYSCHRLIPVSYLVIGEFHLVIVRVTLQVDMSDMACAWRYARPILSCTLHGKFIAPSETRISGFLPATSRARWNIGLKSSVALFGETCIDTRDQLKQELLNRARTLSRGFLSISQRII